MNREPLSMRRLAVAAGVSPATPYNLFGTKRRLFVALYQEQRKDLIARLDASEQPDAFARMFHAIHLFGRELAEEPTFFRALFATIYASDPDDDAPRGEDPGMIFWHGLVRRLKDEGLVRAALDIDAFTANFVYLISGATLDWVEARIDVDRWETAVGYGLALASMSVSSPSQWPSLAARRDMFEARIAQAAVSD